MITIRLVVRERSDNSLAKGSRRCITALNDGIRWAGKRMAALGLGEGLGKEGIGKSWKWMLESERGSQPWMRSLA